MYCFKCGASLEDNAKYCNSCGNEVVESLNITYDDPKEEAEDPVILESHTFKGDNELPKKIQEELEKEENKKTSFLQILLFVLLFLGIMGGVGYFVICPLFIPEGDDRQVQKNISDDLSSGNFSINGVVMTLKKPYSYYVKKGWQINSSYLEKDYEMVLGKNEKTSVDYHFQNSNVHGAKIFAGFYNVKEESSLLSECLIYGISATIENDDSNLKFVLPGKIKTNSSIDDVISQYGEIEEDYIYSFEEDGYVVYLYEEEDSYSLSLTFDEEKGLIGFRYEVV